MSWRGGMLALLAIAAPAMEFGRELAWWGPVPLSTPGQSDPGGMGIVVAGWMAGDARRETGVAVRRRDPLVPDAQVWGGWARADEPANSILDSTESLRFGVRLGSDPLAEDPGRVQALVGASYTEGLISAALEAGVSSERKGLVAANLSFSLFDASVVAADSGTEGAFGVRGRFSTTGGGDAFSFALHRVYSRADGRETASATRVSTWTAIELEDRLSLLLAASYTSSAGGLRETVEGALGLSWMH